MFNEAESGSLRGWIDSRILWRHIDQEPDASLTYMLTFADLAELNASECVCE
jgi:hypothetical protein